MLKRSLFLFAVLAFAGPALAAPIIMPLVKPLALRGPLFDITFGRPGGGGSGGGGWGTQPSSNGCITRTGSNTFSAVSFAADAGITLVGGDCQSGTVTFGLDLSMVNRFSADSGNVPATGAVGTEYIENDRIADYFYPVTNTPYWRLSLAAGVGTSGGVPYFTATADKIGSSAALTVNMPVIGGGPGTAPAVGTVSGNTTQFVTTTGGQTSGDCVKIDANGNHVANGSACGSGFDPSTLNLYEEFLTGTSSIGQLGSTGASFTAIASGSLATVTGAVQHPGLVRLSSHATNDNSGDVVYLANSVSAVTYDTWTTHDWQLDAVMLPGANGTAITSAGYYVGLMSSNADPNGLGGGIWIKHDSDDSDSTYTFAICNSATNGCGSAGDDTNQKTVASTITPVAGTYNRFRIRRAASGVGGNPTIYFRVDSETEKTFCSSGCDDTLGTIPASGNLFFGIAYLTRTTTGVLSAEVDMMSINITGLSR